MYTYLYLSVSSYGCTRALTSDLNFLPPAGPVRTVRMEPSQGPMQYTIKTD